MTFVFVDTPEALLKATTEWEKEQTLGIDLECENQLHHYGVFIAIIQVSTPRGNWIIDTIKLKEMDPFCEILQNPKIEKIFHDTSFDIRILRFQYKCKIQNIFDTQVGALFLGMEEKSLSALLDHYFGLTKEEKFQTADWTRRPLTDDMLAYATKDSMYLIRLRDRIIKDLQKMGRVMWVEQVNKDLENRIQAYSIPGFQDLKGIGKLTEKERAIARRIYVIREQLAKRVDRPVHFIMSNKRMIDFAREPPTLNQWRSLNGVHPIVKRQANRFHEAVTKGKNEKLVLKKNGKRMTARERRETIKLNELRTKIACELKMDKTLVMTKDQMLEIVRTNSNKPLMQWQQALIRRYGS